MKVTQFKALIICMSLLFSPFIFAKEGDLLVRARIINVSPSADSDVITAIGGGTPLGANATIDVDSKVTLDIDFTWFLTDHFGLELLLDLSSVHDIKGDGDLAGAGKLGEARVLPPALIAQYHFSPRKHSRPYVGAGINYTIFFDEETTPTTTTALGATSTGLDIDPTLSFVLQAGIDIDINEDYFLNFDMKYMMLDTTATISANGSDAATVDFDLNPFVFGVGLGMRF